MTVEIAVVSTPQREVFERLESICQCFQTAIGCSVKGDQKTDLEEVSERASPGHNNTYVETEDVDSSAYFRQLNTSKIWSQKRSNFIEASRLSKLE